MHAEKKGPRFRQIHSFNFFTLQCSVPDDHFGITSLASVFNSTDLILQSDLNKTEITELTHCYCVKSPRFVRNRRRIVAKDCGNTQVPKLTVLIYRSKVAVFENWHPVFLTEEYTP